MSTITVNDGAALNLALSSAQAGDTILLAAGTYSGVSIKNVNISGTVNIQSADSAHAATLTNFCITSSSGLNFSNLECSTVNSPDPFYAFRINQSQNIHFDGLNVHGSLDGDAANDAGAFHFYESSNISVANSEFQQVARGVAIIKCDGVVVSGNEFHDIRTDGIDCAGTSNIQISHNSFTDFYPSDLDHADAIQFMTSTTSTSAHDIVISDNILTRGKGEIFQGIFMKDEVGTLPYQNVKITGNALAGTMFNGIGVYHAQNLEISNNTVQAYSDMHSWIHVLNADGVAVTDNQSGWFVYESDTNLIESGNLIIKSINAPETTTTTVIEPDAVSSAVTYTLGAASHNLILTGTGNIDGTGNDLGDTITGNIGANHLTGGAGADTISDGGGAGADTMAGKAGDDTYYVNNTMDLLIEDMSAGKDTAFASVNHTLAVNVENLVLTGSANIDGTGNGSDNIITGNTGANHLAGGAGADTISDGGGAGVDTMTGGTGDDAYTVNNAADVIVEKVGEGTDVVSASVSYKLGLNIETLVLTGSANIDGTANALGDKITGNSGLNHLNGGAGADLLDGGAGADSMTGGSGNDTFVVDANDVVYEKGGQGDDLVQASVTYSLSSNIENLVLTGTGNIGGYGSNAANVMTGNSGANRLEGYGGNDTINGGGGNDSIGGSGGSDMLTGGSGDDVFRFNIRGGHDVVSDFHANGDHDQLDITNFVGHRYQPVIQDHGTYTTVSFATGDSIDLMGVHAADLHLNGGFIL